MEQKHSNVTLNQVIDYNVAGSNKIKLETINPDHFITSNNPMSQESLKECHKRYNTDYNIQIIVKKVSEAKAQEFLRKVVDTLMDIHYIRDEADYIKPNTNVFGLGRALHAICVYMDLIKDNYNKRSAYAKEIGPARFSGMDPFFLFGKDMTLAKLHLGELKTFFNIYDTSNHLSGSKLAPEDEKWFYLFSEPLVQVGFGLTIPINRKPCFYSPSYDIWKHYVLGLMNARHKGLVLENYGKLITNEKVMNTFVDYFMEFDVVLNSVRDIIVYKDLIDEVDFNKILVNAINRLEEFRIKNDERFVNWTDNIANFEESRNANGIDNNHVYFAGSLEKSILYLNRAYRDLADNYMYRRLERVSGDRASIRFTKDVSYYLIENLTFMPQEPSEPPKPEDIVGEEEEKEDYHNGIFFQAHSLTAIIWAILSERDPELYEKIKNAYEKDMISKEEMFVCFNYVLSTIHKHFKITTRATVGKPLDLWEKTYKDVKNFLKTIKEDNFIMESLTSFTTHILDYVLMYSILDDPTKTTTGQHGGVDETGVQLDCFKHKRALVVGILDKALNLDNYDPTYDIKFTKRDSLSVRSDMSSLMVELERLRNPKLEDNIPNSKLLEQIDAIVAESPEEKALEAEKLRVEFDTENHRIDLRNGKRRELSEYVKTADDIKAAIVEEMFQYSCCLRPDSDKAGDTIKAIADAWYRYNNMTMTEIEEEIRENLGNSNS